VLEILEKRGTDASGVTYGSWNSNAGYIKNCVKGSQLFEHESSKPYLTEIEKAQIVLMHCRAETQGSKMKAENNHPVFQKEGKYILVHNGQIRNDDDLFHETCDLKLKREAEVDTEALVALLGTEEDPLRALETLRFAVGTYAVAAMPRRKIDHVLISRRSSPIVLSYDKGTDTLYFGSTTESLSPYYDLCSHASERGFTQSSLTWPWEIDDNEGLIITKKGLSIKTKYTPDLKYHVGFSRGYRAWAGHGVDDSDFGHHSSHMGGFGAYHYPLARKDSGVATPIFILPHVNFKNPDMGHVKDGRVGVKLAKGFIGLPSIGTQLSMRTFPNGVFPKLAEEDKEMAIKCPACWKRVRAMAMQQQAYTCPQCRTTVDKPKLFRTLTDIEKRTAYFSEVNT
jgi:hypothetical protein